MKLSRSSILKAKDLLLRKFLQNRLKISYDPKITIGKHTYGFENISSAWGGNTEVVIGSFTSIASNLQLQLGGNHNSQWVSTYPFGHVSKDRKIVFGPPVPLHPVPARSIVIGNDVWLGNNVTIMGGVRIEDGAIIAMNSHVVGNVGAYEVYGGNPARKIRDRFPPEIIKELCDLKWWEAEDEKIELIKHLLTNAPTMHSISEMRNILHLATMNEKEKI